MRSFDEVGLLLIYNTSSRNIEQLMVGGENNRQIQSLIREMAIENQIDPELALLQLFWVRATDTLVAIC